MKIRKNIILSAVLIGSFVLSSCSDELENLLPEPTETNETSFTGGTGGEDIETP